MAYKESEILVIAENFFIETIMHNCKSVLDFKNMANNSLSGRQKIAWWVQPRFHYKMDNMSLYANCVIVQFKKSLDELFNLSLLTKLEAMTFKFIYR